MPLTFFVSFPPNPDLLPWSAMIVRPLQVLAAPLSLSYLVLLSWVIPWPWLHTTLFFLGACPCTTDKHTSQFTSIVIYLKRPVKLCSDHSLFPKSLPSPTVLSTISCLLSP